MKKALILIVKIVVIVFLLLLIVFSSVKLYEYNKGKFENRTLAEQVVEKQPTDEKKITVDFDALLAKNRDVIGWLYCENTPINYAVVRAEDNSFYLRRGIDGQYSHSGSLFADFRNAPDFTDINTVIYGHNMNNSEMFGTLIKYKEQKYFDSHPEFLLITPSASYTVSLIAGFEEKSTPEFYEKLVSFGNAEEMINGFIEKSTFKSDYAFSENDRFITFSTCTDDYSSVRFLLVGKLSQ